jgi:hypothetical protein
MGLPSSGSLNLGIAGVISARMRQGPLVRLRALVLLVALGIGLAGQAMASGSMSMAQEDGSGMAVSMQGMDGCPGCTGRDSSDNSSKALAPSCALAFCSISMSPAILPQGPAFIPPPRVTLILTAAERVQGISIRPDLDPPRPIRHA